MLRSSRGGCASHPDRERPGQDHTHMPSFSTRLPSRLVWDRPTPSWPLLVGLAALVRPLFEPTTLLNDPDTYLHIATGRWILAHGSLPSHDPFSHSMPGAAWVPHEWMAEVIM